MCWLGYITSDEYLGMLQSHRGSTRTFIPINLASIPSSSDQTDAGGSEKSMLIYNL